MRKTTEASTKKKPERKNTVRKSNIVQTTEKSTKMDLPARRNSSLIRKPVVCKQCLTEFADISKRNAHNCKGEARYYVCDQCDSRFKVKDNFVTHRQTKHSTEVVVRKKIGTKEMKENRHYRTLEIEENLNSQDFGDFVVDALYLLNNQLQCRAMNQECFVTNNAFKMKAHREKYHMLLEQRISFVKWRDLIPANFLTGEVSENDVEMNAVQVKSSDTFNDNNSYVQKRHGSTSEKGSQDAIHKNFGVYLEKLRRRYAGVN